MIYTELPQKPVATKSYEKEFTSVITPSIAVQAEGRRIRYMAFAIVSLLLVGYLIKAKK